MKTLLGFRKIFYIFLIIIAVAGNVTLGSIEDEMKVLHPCQRECQENQTLTCFYEFKIQEYHTMSHACFNCSFNESDCSRPQCIAADGVERSIIVANRMMPGPAIEVCKGDTIVVDVINQLSSGSTVIHWHGLHMKKTPFMDGTPHVSQCPIPPGRQFRYIFEAENSGTHYWHSHLGLQIGDGLIGALIVRDSPASNPHNSLYDFDLYEHVILIQDWTHIPSTAFFTARYHGTGSAKPDNFLINGKGEFSSDQPLEIFKVQKDKRYRFRLINSGTLNCPAEISIDNHNFTVIASDGYNFEPIVVNSLVINAGERFDIILNANQAIDNYWMRVQGDPNNNCQNIFQKAILRYEGSNLSHPDTSTIHNPNKLQLNSVNKEAQDENSISIDQLKGLEKFSDKFNREIDEKIVIHFDFHLKNNPLFHFEDYYGIDKNNSENDNNPRTPQLNHITNKPFDIPLMMTREKIDDRHFCNETILKEIVDCETEFCECTHVLQIPLSSLVEVILVNEGFSGDTNHPFHLHGNGFWVIGMEKLGANVSVEDIKQMDSNGKLKRNLSDPPMKDTVSVPDGGYTIIRFIANNPGYWLFHCHLTHHSELGMSLYFKIGNHNEMKETPKNFPTCSDYIASNDDIEIVTTIEF